MEAAGEPKHFLDHLEILRSILLRIIFVTLLLCIPAWILAPAALDMILDYAAPEGFKLHYFSLLEPFFVRLKISLLLALIAALPWNISQLWKFVSPGLFPKERRIMLLPALIMLLLAVAGTALSLLVIVPAVINFSLSFADGNVSPVVGIGEFTDLVLMVILAGMLLFQFPVVLYLLLKLGIVEAGAVRRKRPLLIVIIFIAAAIFSPPDVISQIALAIPSWLLLEFTLWWYELRSGRS